ncbi:hypothetical protein IGI96_003565 [Enterococcus sp. DIV0421]|uniref:IS110 family transposase n=1 Tax=Enterococcus sp. DIV0421 TaxID=2774688 RepID=UPI003F285E46
MLYVGIDIAKHKHDLAIIDTEGTVFIRHLQIENNREGFTKLQNDACQFAENNRRRDSNRLRRYRSLLL